MNARLTAPIALAVLFLVESAGSASACPFCAGDTTGSQMGQAAGWGIFAMVVIIFAMLGALVAGGFYLNYRARHPLPDYQELLDESETLPGPGTSS